MNPHQGDRSFIPSWIADQAQIAATPSSAMLQLKSNLILQLGTSQQLNAKVRRTKLEKFWVSLKVTLTTSATFSSCDLEPWFMTLTIELDVYRPRCASVPNINVKCHFVRKLSSRQTDKRTKPTERSTWTITKRSVKMSYYLLVVKSS